MCGRMYDRPLAPAFWRTSMTVRDRVINHYALPEVHLTGASEAVKDQCAANGGQGTLGAQH